MQRLVANCEREKVWWIQTIQTKNYLKKSNNNNKKKKQQQKQKQFKHIFLRSKYSSMKIEYYDHDDIR